MKSGSNSLSNTQKSKWIWLTAICYNNRELGTLKYLTNASGSWVRSIVESGVGLNVSFITEPGTSIAIDSNNKVHIGYLKLNTNDCFDQYNACAPNGWPVCKNTVKYATNKSGSWTTEIVYSYYGDTDWVYRPSLAIDSNNKIHIAFAYCDLCADLLYYATNAPGYSVGQYKATVGSWTIGHLPPYPNYLGGGDYDIYPGMFPSLAIDSNNKAHIMQSEWLSDMFRNEGSSGNLWYTTNASGSWTAYEADNGSGYIRDTAVAVFPGNKVHAAYYEEYDRNLLYAPCPEMIPDMIITSISRPPASAKRGSTFSVTDTTTNVVLPCGSRHTARTSITRYRLSSDTTITTSDPLLTGSRSVPSLAGGAISTGSVTVTIPTSLPVGTYYLGACADDTYIVSEGSESNNCTPSWGAIIQVTL